MRKIILIFGLSLVASSALADWTAKNDVGTTITFKNATGACTSVVCVPQSAITDSTGAIYVAVKASSTAAVASDPSLVTNESPNSQLSVASGTAADAPCTLPATTTACSQVALQKAFANAAINAVTLGSASGGLSTSNQSALSNTAVAIDASAGQLYVLYCYNPNASVAYIQLFDVAQGSVTVGTTAPAKGSYGIPPSAASGTTISLVGKQFSTAITAAATAGPTNGTTPGTALSCVFDYK